MTRRKRGFATFQWLTFRWLPFSRLFRRKRRQPRRQQPNYRPFSEVWDEFQRRYPPGELDINPDEVFRDVRSKDPGRDFTF
jgi:hypothetical protein